MSERSFGDPIGQVLPEPVSAKDVKYSQQTKKYWWYDRESGLYVLVLLGFALGVVCTLLFGVCIAVLSGGL